MKLLIRLIIAAKIGTAEIFNNKLRSFLSIFAISIGVLTFLFVFSAINHSREKIEKILDLGGRNTLIFTGLDINKLDMSKYDEILRKFPKIKSISPETDRINASSYSDFGRKDAITVGITPNWKNINWVYGKIKGRFITWDDIEQRRKVAVYVRDPYSNKDKTNYYWSSGYASGRRSGGDSDWFKWSTFNKEVIDKKIKIFSDTYTVVGEIKAPLYKNDERLDVETVDFLIPITSAGDTFPRGNGSFNELMLEVADEKSIESVKKSFTSYLRTMDREDYFRSYTFREQAERRLETIRRNIMLISVLGLIAMISGGIGIMNVVLATIYARTKEIGTRRALGATKADIFLQFSFESVVLSLLGAAAGYVLSFFALDYMAAKMSMEVSLNLLSVLAAFGIAALTGFIFSLYPSLKAANMNPVDALKVE